MSVPTTAELNLLNSHPQMTKLWLSIYQPDTVLSCQVNTGTSKGATTIPYDNVTAGSYTLVEPEVYTMLVGTTPGGDEKGKIRIRSATSGEITVPINSHIDWADDDYLTVLRFVEINPVYQRIIQDPANPENTLWYKYSDVSYTNQNSVLGSFICMGGHYAGFLEGGVCNVYYSASGTYNLKSEAMSFDWFFQGADTTGSAVHTPGYISYSTPGHYMTKLTVTTTGSASDVSYRFISIYDKPSAGATNPILKWELLDLSGSREAGGYTATIQVRDLAYENVIRDGALVVIHAEDWYKTTKQSIGGNSLHRENTFFSGYILNGTIQYNYQDGYIEFEVVSPTEMMKSMEGFAIDVTSSTDPAGQSATDPNYPSGWTLLLEMDCRRAIYHYLRWHSTVLYCTDFDVNYFGTDLAIEHFTSDRNSIYDAINTLMQGTLVGEVVADRQGKIFAEVSVQATNNASGSFATAMTIEKRHWIGTPIIDERQTQEISFIEMGGIKYDGPSAATFNAFLSCAPGNEPGLRGKMEQIQGLALSSQAQLNQLVGNVFAYRNSRYPNINYRLAGNYRNLDIAPQQLVSLTISQTDTPRGTTFTKKPFTIRNMNWEYDAKQELLVPSMAVAEVTQGFSGDTIVIPDVPPVESPSTGGGFYIPPIIFPVISLPPITPAFQHQHHILYLHPPFVTTQPAGSSPPHPATGDIYWDAGWSGIWATDAIGYYDPEMMYVGTGKYINIQHAGYYFVSVEFLRYLGVITGDYYAAYSIRTEVNDLTSYDLGQIIGVGWKTLYFKTPGSTSATPTIYANASGIGYYPVGTRLSFNVAPNNIGTPTLTNVMGAKLSLFWLSS